MTELHVEYGINAADNALSYRGWMVKESHLEVRGHKYNAIHLGFL